jgi:FAD/FMN-containing dehydrogenase
MTSGQAVININGSAVQESAVAGFKARFRGELLWPGDDAYESARRVWNGMIDRRPALIAQCAGAADVIAAVRFARENDILASVRGGGHNVAGLAVADGGLMIDLSHMRAVRVDPARGIARAEPGVTLGVLDHETQAFGLVAPAGIVTTTGIAGLTLGGGFGWLSRKHGLTCDNLLSVDVVTAEGKLTAASERENPDLFWGVRGGGGNFGIVTSFEYRLHGFGPTALAGLVFYPMSEAGAVLRAWRDYIPTTPEELTTIAFLRIAPPAPFLPPHVHGTPVLIIGACYAGPIEEGERVVRPLRELATPLVDLLSPKPFTAHQATFDAAQPPGHHRYWKSHNLTGLTDEAIDTIVAHASEISSPLSLVGLFQLGGAVSRVGEDATAYSDRRAGFNMNIASAWLNTEEADRHIGWTRGLSSAMQPFSTGGVYLNFQADEGPEQVRAAYGAGKLERLAALKSRYDPSNFFRLNQNIRPAAG